MCYNCVRLCPGGTAAGTMNDSIEEYRGILTVKARMLKEMVRPLLQPLAGLRSREIGLAESGVTRRIAKALGDTLSGTVSPAEKDWIDRIELLRKRLGTSTREIEIVDYGAGTQTENRTELQMREGRKEFRKISMICQSAGRPRFWSLLLFRILRELRPESCVEMGTSLGISAAYQAAALELNGKGTLSTLEGAPLLAETARENLTGIGLDNVSVVPGRFQDTLGRVLEEKKPVDYLFVDGHHEEKATLQYFEKALPFLHGEAVLVFDDISWTRGMRSAWQRIKGDDRIQAAVDLHQVGIAVLDGSARTRQTFDVFLV